MNYDITKEQNELKEKISAFCIEEIEPKASLLDSASAEDVNDIIKENIKKLAGIGYLGLCHDGKYGGGDFDTLSLAIAGEEVAKACPSTALSANTSSQLFGLPVKLYGTDEQKDKYLHEIVKGGLIGCYAITEPGAGSDIAGITASAEKKGDKWVLNGIKSLITNASIADAALVFAYTDRDAGLEAGISCFIVDKETPGFSSGKPLDKMGFRGSPTAELKLENCELSENSILGEIGRGSEIADYINDIGKLNGAVISLGIGMKCMELSNQYSKTRQAFGKPINRYQEISFKIADMYIAIDISRLLIHKAAWAKDCNDPEASVIATCAKVFAGENTVNISSMALQVNGGSGFIKDNPVERLYRDAKLGDIINGTTETHRMSIAQDILDKYAS